MSPSLQNRNAPSKDCTVSGCSGTMTLPRPGSLSAQEVCRASDVGIDNNPS